MSTASSLFDRDRSAERLPVSLITGFLGSGKTTLLNRLLRRPEMADSAVIINEFGEVALDHLLVEPVTGEAVVLASGCLCCAVRGDLQDALRRLLVQRDRGEVPAFSRVLIETSGLADPAPVVQLLLNNPLLGHDLRLDTVVATVDGVGGLGQLEQYAEALKQAAIADRLLVTKTDLASVRGRRSAAPGFARDQSRARRSKPCSTAKSTRPGCSAPDSRRTRPCSVAEPPGVWRSRPYAWHLRRLVSCRAAAGLACISPLAWRAAGGLWRPVCCVSKAC